MSSSAFFIEAAANTVRVLSSAKACEWAAASAMNKVAKSPARRTIESAPCVLAARKSRANRLSVEYGRDLRKRCSGDPRRTYGRRECRWANHNRLKILVKAPVCPVLLARQDRDRDRILLGATDLQHE